LREDLRAVDVRERLLPDWKPGFLALGQIFISLVRTGLDTLTRTASISY